MSPNILIADDDEEYRTSIARALFPNQEINTASNAYDAIEKAKNNKYSLIITDNQMEHENDGLYVIQEIRKFNQETPIILHTADTDMETEALNKGANEVINKPANLRNFKEQAYFMLKDKKSSESYGI